MQVRRQQYLRRRVARRLFKELQTVPHQLQRRINADSGRNGGGAGGTRQSRRSNPEITHPRAQRCPRLAALKEPDAEITIGVEQSYRQIAIPEAQSVHFVLPLHVRHANLQDCGGPI
jgi:hypothetical protein